MALPATTALWNEPGRAASGRLLPATPAADCNLGQRLLTERTKVATRPGAAFRISNKRSFAAVYQSLVREPGHMP